MPGDEPWGEWLSPAVKGRFVKLWSPGSSDAERASTLVAVAAVVEPEVKQCLKVPLSLLYDDYQPPAPGRPSKAQETWGSCCRAGRTWWSAHDRRGEKCGAAISRASCAGRPIPRSGGVG